MIVAPAHNHPKNTVFNIIILHHFLSMRSLSSKVLNNPHSDTYGIQNKNSLVPCY